MRSLRLIAARMTLGPILFILPAILHAQTQPPSNGLSAGVWAPVKAPLMSKFAKDVDPAHVLPEYPRPQLERKVWLNLNGLWQFQAGVAGETPPRGKLSGTILVPFPVESALSGVREHHERIWYRRTFTVPAAWGHENILLHFGAVDYESETFINGKSLGIHKGGYDPFSYDITAWLKKTGSQEITVRVFDPTDAGGQPRGKQTLDPRGIMYTSVTGIWQTVWLEPVPEIHIDNIRMTPDIDLSVLKLVVNTEAGATAAGSPGATAMSSAADAGTASAMNSTATSPMISVKVKDGSTVIRTITGLANEELLVPVPNAKLWSPDSPFLYGLEISLIRGSQTKKAAGRSGMADHAQRAGNRAAGASGGSAGPDRVSSYFGMRKISVEDQGGYKKLFLNNKFLFESGPLDQGFWPDGGYTAPTDQALRSDLQQIKDFGFNMVRKHIKVEPYRWYYWADRLGLMVWQDMPSPNSYTEKVPPVDTAEFSSELTRLVKNHWNSPCIIMWVIFNEGQAQHNTPGYVKMVHALDPSRLINQASGGGHFGVGDLMDIHSYPPPAAPSSSTQALACGEYGGIGFKIKDHMWREGETYVMIDNVKSYTDLYDQFARDLTVFKTDNGLSAAVYTEITDVETELNGLITYDRAVVKGPVEKIRASNLNVINGSLHLTPILPASVREGRTWKYTLTTPDKTWPEKDFLDSSWKTGIAGFGTTGTLGAIVRTTWNTDDIWVRQRFTLPDLSAINRENLILSIHHDDDCEVFINGVHAATMSGATSGYAMGPISPEARAALVSNGPNVIAIHCKQTGGGQYIDAGISLVSGDKP